MIWSFEILLSVIRDSRFCRSRFYILSSEILTSVVRDSHFSRSRFCRSPPREERSLFTSRSNIPSLFRTGYLVVVPSGYYRLAPPHYPPPPSVAPVKEGAPPPPRTPRPATPPPNLPSVCGKDQFNFKYFKTSKLLIHVYMDERLFLWYISMQTAQGSNNYTIYSLRSFSGGLGFEAF